MQLSFAGRVVLVTGSGTGIGRAVAKEFGSSGAKVAVHYNQSADQALEVVNEIRAAGGEAIAFQADVSNSRDVSRLFDEVLRHFGRLDVLVNNAGSLIQRSPIEDMTEELWERVFSVNVTSVFLCCKRAIRIMKAQGGGKIVNISSQAARNGGGAGSVAYASAKGAVSTFTKGLAKELAPFGILVNGVAPGVISTPFHDRYTPPELRQSMQKSIPLGREGSPEECAGAVLFLASDAGSYITGEMIEVNGGTLMD